MPLLRSASGRARWRKAWWLRRARTPKIDHDAMPGIPWGCVTWWIIPWTWAYIVQWWIAEAHSTIWTGNVFQTLLDCVGPFLVSMSGIVSLQAWLKSPLIHCRLNFEPPVCVGQIMSNPFSNQHALSSKPSKPILVAGIPLREEIQCGSFDCRTQQRGKGAREWQISPGAFGKLFQNKWAKNNERLLSRLFPFQA